MVDEKWIIRYPPGVWGKSFDFDKCVDCNRSFGGDYSGPIAWLVDAPTRTWLCERCACQRGVMW